MDGMVVWIGEDMVGGTGHLEGDISAGISKYLEVEGVIR